MACWNHVKAFVTSSPLLLTLTSKPSSVQSNTEFIDQITIVGNDSLCDYPMLLDYENEEPNPGTMTFSREADNLEIGWATYGNPSINFFLGLCITAEAEEVFYAWGEDASRTYKKLVYSGNSFIYLSQ